MNEHKADIIDFRPEFANRFRELNMEWIERFFVAEALDREVLGNPQDILAAGGVILFAQERGNVVGTCALVAEEGGSGHYELAKMAVTAASQGKGIGRRLLAEALCRFTALGGMHLHLETSSRLAAAMRLYESCGFRRVRRPGGPSPYARADVYMIYSP